jgi:DNA-binding LytR/AlgR family response regulator
VFKIILICLVPPVILWLSDAFKEMKRNNDLLTEEINGIKQQILKYKEDYQNISMEFSSDKSSENITLLISDVAFIRSADNYIEIVFREDDKFKKKLQRNTLRNIEQQLRPFANFIRCHRTCIVNTYYIEEFSRKFNNHWLRIKGYDEQIPVSRQYLVKLKEAL